MGKPATVDPRTKCLKNVVFFFVLSNSINTELESKQNKAKTKRTSVQQVESTPHFSLLEGKPGNRSVLLLGTLSTVTSYKDQPWSSSGQSKPSWESVTDEGRGILLLLDSLVTGSLCTESYMGSSLPENKTSCPRHLLKGSPLRRTKTLGKTEPRRYWLSSPRYSSEWTLNSELTC